MSYKSPGGVQDITASYMLILVLVKNTILYKIVPGYVKLRFTHSIVIKKVEQRDEESSPMLPVSSDHGEQVRAEC